MTNIQRVSASRLACEAMRWHPMGSPGAHNGGHCAMCGHRLDKETPALPLKDAINEKSFTDWTFLARGATHVCGWCARTVTSKAKGYDPNSGKSKVVEGDFTQTYADVVITPEGIFPFRTNQARAWFLLNPPEPPYVLWVKSAQRQHVVWRANVNYSRDLMVFPHGFQTLVVRPAQLERGKEAYDELLRRYQSLPGNKSRKTLFIRGLSRTLESTSHGAFSDRVLEWINQQGDPEIRECLEIVRSLTPGELWALGALTALKDTPQKPKPFVIM